MAISVRCGECGKPIRHHNKHRKYNGHRGAIGRNIKIRKEAGKFVELVGRFRYAYKDREVVQVSTATIGVRQNSIVNEVVARLKGVA